MTVVSCIGCEQKLRVPAGKRGTVTCPHCGAAWFHPETLELSDVEFRCSFTGARFNVISSRRSPLHRFTIQAIKKAGSMASRSPTEEQPRPHQSPAVGSTMPLLPPSPTRVGGWLARVLGRKPDVVPVVPRPDMSEDQVSDAPTTVRANYNADEYNWSGFSCPYCAASNFVSRWGGHLVCDGSSELRNGQKFHQCFCGHAGFITGIIKTVESKRLSVEEKLAAPKPLPTDSQKAARQPGDTALPTPPPKGGLPAR